MAYVYRHIRLDKNIPFYIGIGNDGKYKRAKDTFARNMHWRNIVSKTDYEIQIIADNLSLDAAKEKEREFISIYKRSIDGGTLANITLGGEGVLGLKNPKLSERNKCGIWKGKTHTDETKRKIGEKHKGKTISVEHRQRVSESKIEKKAWSGAANPKYRGTIRLFENGILIREFMFLQELADYLHITLSRAFRFLKGLNTPSISSRYSASRKYCD